MNESGFETIDYIIFGAYIVLLICLGLFLSRNKNGNDGADADRAIQDPANQQNHTDDDGLHQTDGMIWEPLAQGDCQRIARAAALPGRHIKILPEAHHEQPDNNKNNAQTEIAADGNGMEIRNPIDIIAN